MERAVVFIKRAAFPVLFLLLSAATLSGQDLNPRLIFQSGGSFINSERNFVVDGNSMRSQFASGGKATLRGAMDINRHWSVEAGYSYGTNNLRIFDLTDAVQRDYGVRLHQFSGNALAFLNGPDSRVRVFGTAGVGLQHFSPTDKAKKIAAASAFVDEKAIISSTNSMGTNFGGGAELRATDQFGLRFDFRDHITSIPRFGVPQVNPGNGADFYPVDGHVQNVELSVGVVIYMTPHVSRPK